MAEFIYLFFCSDSINARVQSSQIIHLAPFCVSFFPLVCPPCLLLRVAPVGGLMGARPAAAGSKKKDVTRHIF